MPGVWQHVLIAFTNMLLAVAGYANIVVCQGVIASWDSRVAASAEHSFITFAIDGFF